MQALINVFFTIKFFPSLLIGASIFAPFAPKRKYFVLRFISSFCVFCAVAVMIWRVVRDNAGTGFTGGLAYVACDVFFFFAVIAFLCFNFRVSFFQAVLYDASGWGIEHIGNSLSIILALLLKVENIYINYSVEYFTLTFLVYTIVYVAAAIVSWAFCRESAVNINKKRILLPTLLILFTTIILGVYTPVADTPSNVMVILKLFAFICCIISLCLSISIFEAGRYRYELDAIELADRKRREQYEISKETIDAINVKCHDLKKLIGSVLGQKKVLTDEEIQNLNKQISIYDAIIKTGNEAFDLIITEKSLYCEKNGIAFTVMADGDLLGFMSDADIYSLFGNILDNATEASVKVEAGWRAISLRVKRSANMLLIHEDNYFNGRLKYSNGNLVTSKDNTTDHGYGVMSIKRVAEKYGGSVSLSTSGNVFSLDVLLPLKNECFCH